MYGYLVPRNHEQALELDNEWKLIFVDSREISESVNYVSDVKTKRSHS
jgi:hypothetical protein